MGRFKHFHIYVKYNLFKKFKHIQQFGNFNKHLSENTELNKMLILLYTLSL